MKVAIDSGPLSGGHSIRGVGAYTRELLSRLSDIKPKNLKIDYFDFSENKDKITSGEYDIVHFTFFNPYFINLPLVKKSKIVVTIHDLIPLIYPKHYSPGIKGSIRLAVNRFLVREYVDRIITVSETSKKDICRFFDVEPEKVVVIYEAPRNIFRKLAKGKWEGEIKHKYNLPDKFILYVGDVNYNKNIPTLLSAGKKSGVNLVLVGKQALDIEDRGIDLRSLKGPMDYIRFLFGKPHPELAHYQSLLKEFQDNDKIIRLGFVKDNDLVKIYNLATVYCQPSFYEGFGLPVVEAFASGCPVVAAKNQALVEIGEVAALFAEPRDSNDFARKIKSVYNDSVLQSQLVNSGLEVVKHFSWEKTARETIETYLALHK